MKPDDTLYPHEWLWQHAKKYNGMYLVISAAIMTILSLITVTIYIIDSMSISNPSEIYTTQFSQVSYQPSCFSYSPVLCGILCVLIAAACILLNRAPKTGD